MEEDVNWWSAQAAGIVLTLILSPLYLGIAQTVKARMQGRRGPAVIQGYWVIGKTWRKETTVPEHSSFVFRLAPSLSLSALVTIVIIIPWGGHAPNGWPHDLLSVFFLLALERFWVGLSGLDSAGTFGGLGASRITTLGSGIEPALFAVFGLMFLLSGGTNIVPITPKLSHPMSTLPWLLAAFGYALVLLAELGRLPVDNPDTHLELTMMHEATVLEYNGRLLAQSQLSTALKFTVMTAMGWIILAPSAASPWVNIGILQLELAVSSILLGWTESRFVKLRYFRLPRYFGTAMGAGMLAVYLAASRGWL